ILSIIVVMIFKIDIKKYNESNKLFTSLLTPATVCLAIPLYEQFEKLKNNWKAILGGILAGVLTSLSLVLLLCIILELNHETYVSLLPKSITTAIGLVVSDQLGGIVPITVAVIIVTGIFGNVFAELILKIFHITDPVAKGIAIGTASHALGTAKAIEMGEIEGAMSSLSIAVTGLLTVIGSSIFAQFL
ncbi:MAG: LrgB family protein, partial [Treponema sp.]|nr:LrgB family protein [Treponema sp.]